MSLFGPTAALVALLFGSVVASNPSQDRDSGALAIGFQRDSDFAKRLADRGYRSQAKWVVDRLRGGSGLTEEQKAAIQYVDATIALSAFDLERDFDKAKALYDEAKAAIRAYLAAAPNGADAARARYEGGDLDRKLGEKVITQMGALVKAGGASEKIAELRKVGEEAFQAANDYFQRRMVETRDEAMERNVSLGDYEPWLAAAYAVPNNYLTWAFLYPPGDSKRIANLRSACTNFDDFLLNVNDDRVIYFEAYVKYGNARRELGEADAATECYNLALGLMYWSDEDNNRFLHEPGDLTTNDRQLILNAAAEISKLWNVKAQHDEVLKVFADCKKAIPNLYEYERGAEFVVEAARAMEALGRRQQAIDECRRVVGTAIPGAPVWNEAKDLLDRLGGAADRVLTSAEVVGPTVALINDARFADAIRTYQSMRDRIRGTDAEKSFGADLMLAGGRAYQGAGRQLEAILTWGYAAERYPEKVETAAKAYFASVMQVCQLWSATKFAWLETMAQDLLDSFQSNLPDHELLPQAQELFLSSQKKVGGKPPLELARLVEDQLKAISKTDVKFGRLTYDAGKSYYSAGSQTKKKPEKEQARAGAERMWEQYLDWLKSQSTLDPAEKSRNEDRMVFVLLSRAQMWLWEPGAAVEKTFALLGQIEDMMTKVQAARAKVLEVDQVKVRAYLQQGALDKAIAVVEGMLTKAPDSSRTAFELKRVSDFIWTEVTKSGDKLSHERMTQLLDWGIRYLREWVQTGDKSPGSIDATALNEAGTRMFQFGLLKNGVTKYPGTFYLIDSAKFAFQEATQLAAEYYEKALASYQGNNVDFVNTVRYRRGAALGILQRWKELAETYQSIVKDDPILEPTEGGGYKIGPPRQGRTYPAEKFLNDYAYALAQLARAAGDRAAGAEAQQIASAVIVATEPKGAAEPTFDFWFARYVAMLAADANGERTKVQERYLFYTRTDKELDNDKFGFRKKLTELYVKNK